MFFARAGAGSINQVLFTSRAYCLRRSIPWHSCLVFVHVRISRSHSGTDFVLVLIICWLQQYLEFTNEMQIVIDILQTF